MKIFPLDLVRSFAASQWDLPLLGKGEPCDSETMVSSLIKPSVTSDAITISKAARAGYHCQEGMGS